MSQFTKCWESKPGLCSCKSSVPSIERHPQSTSPFFILDFYILSQSPECLDYRREPLNLIEIFINILSQGDCHMDPCGTEWVFTGGWACAHLVSGSEGPEVFICTELCRNSLREGMNGWIHEWVWCCYQQSPRALWLCLGSPHWTFEPGSQAAAVVSHRGTQSTL